MTPYHDRKTAPLFKCFFKPSLEFNMIILRLLPSTAFKSSFVYSTGEDVPSLRGTLRCGVFPMNYLSKALDNCC